MNTGSLEKLRYPIGHFVVPNRISDTTIANWITELEAFPIALEDLVRNLSKDQLETPYRQGGWTIRQVVHHLADSHHNSYIRFKWALTEEKPLVKAYDEKAWAELFDTRTAPLNLSLNHLKAVHAKLVFLLRGLSREALSRKFVHPDNQAEISLVESLGHYAWHGNHHYHHIWNLLKQKGWLLSDV